VHIWYKNASYFVCLCITQNSYIITPTDMDSSGMFGIISLLAMENEDLDTQ